MSEERDMVIETVNGNLLVKVLNEKKMVGGLIVPDQSKNTKVMKAEIVVTNGNYDYCDAEFVYFLKGDDIPFEDGESFLSEDKVLAIEKEDEEGESYGTVDSHTKQGIVDAVTDMMEERL